MPNTFSFPMPIAARPLVVLPILLGTPPFVPLQARRGGCQFLLGQAVLLQKRVNGRVDRKGHYYDLNRRPVGPGAGGNR